MPASFSLYNAPSGTGPAYEEVREFYLELNDPLFSYARWDWMITHTYLDEAAVPHIGLWRHKEKLVGVATFDTLPGTTYIHTLPGYEGLKGEMIAYAEGHLQPAEGEFSLMVTDTDASLQLAAARAGHRATTDKEQRSLFRVEQNLPLRYHLPDGFAITALADTYDPGKYGSVLWNGFDHEKNGEGPWQPTPEKLAALERELKRENVDLSLKVAVTAPDGRFVSFCGMWYDPLSGFAEVEPVATHPDFRRMGLGRAAVLEGIRRVANRGAQLVYVGSGLQFYYDIGFRPHTTGTAWKKR